MRFRRRDANEDCAALASAGWRRDATAHYLVAFVDTLAQTAIEQLNGGIDSR